MECPIEQHKIHDISKEMYLHCVQLLGYEGTNFTIGNTSYHLSDFALGYVRITHTDPITKVGIGLGFTKVQALELLAKE